MVTIDTNKRGHKKHKKAYALINVDTFTSRTHQDSILMSQSKFWTNKALTV